MSDQKKNGNLGVILIVLLAVVVIALFVFLRNPALQPGQKNETVVNDLSRTDCTHNSQGVCVEEKAVEAFVDCCQEFCSQKGLLSVEPSNIRDFICYCGSGQDPSLKLLLSYDDIPTTKFDCSKAVVYKEVEILDEEAMKAKVQELFNKTE